VTSLEKALSILELVLDQGLDFSITEISQKLGMGKGTVHRKIQIFISQFGRHLRLSCGLRGVGKHRWVEEKVSAHSYKTETTNCLPLKT
jgi:hypothetical protein